MTVLVVVVFKVKVSLRDKALFSLTTTFFSMLLYPSFTILTVWLPMMISVRIFGVCP